MRNDCYVDCNGRCCFSSSSGGTCAVGNCGDVGSHYCVGDCISGFAETVAFIESAKYWRYGKDIYERKLSAVLYGWAESGEGYPYLSAAKRDHWAACVCIWCISYIYFSKGKERGAQFGVAQLLRSIAYSGVICDCLYSCSKWSLFNWSSCSICGSNCSAFRGNTDACVITTDDSDTSAILQEISWLHWYWRTFRVWRIW